MTVLELHDIQGIVLFAYASLRHARYLHVSFEADARPNRWLAELRHEVHGGRRDTHRPEERLHLAFTHAGLHRLGLGKDELESFPRELQQGMGNPLRAHVLGDDPATWDFGAPSQPPLHALLLLFAKTPEAMDALRDRLVSRLANFGGAVVHDDSAELREPNREPFGFRDGIAQPHIAGSPRSRRSQEIDVPAGEFVLGYPNAYRELPPSPVGKDGFDIGKNGSYLVYRKLRQDTSGFWQCMLDRAEPPGDPKAATKLASAIVGRWPSGAPLSKYPHRDPGVSRATDDFTFFADDPDGLKCPLGAHIRRANPRDMMLPSPKDSMEAALRHRLLRRGRPYGPSAPATPLEAAKPQESERGLVFLALNASFRRQFEFVQQTWINNPKFGGLYDERDPLVGSVDAKGQHFSIPGTPARRRLANLETFVSMRGGGYFFVPGLSALEWISRADRAP
jgi:Dyp-type peroxidase family